ncbi:hypothetical protein D3C73_1263750 [compost metagenome]
MTESALQGASVEAIVGTMMTGLFSSSATAFTVSSVLPPPIPTTRLVPFFFATSTRRLISLVEASPENFSRANSTLPETAASTFVPIRPQTISSDTRRAFVPISER